MIKLCREVWIEVNLDAVKKNLRAIRRHIPHKSKIMAVVKANGYGHGSIEVSLLLPVWRKESFYVKLGLQHLSLCLVLHPLVV